MTFSPEPRGVHLPERSPERPTKRECMSTKAPAVARNGRRRAALWRKRCGWFGEHRAPPPDQRSASQAGSDCRSVWSAWDQGALALSGGVLAASWSFNRCLSANVSAAILFEKIARTGPLLSPSLTAKNAPSWVTTYVAISLIWHSSLQNYSAEPVDRR